MMRVFITAVNIYDRMFLSTIIDATFDAKYSMAGKARRLVRRETFNELALCEAN